MGENVNQDSLNPKGSINGREGEIKNSNISVLIFYGPHGTAKDMEGLADRFAETDIYIPEQLGWTKEDHEFYNEISQGTKTPEEALSEKGIDLDEVGDSLFLQELKIIYNSSKPIIFIDLPADKAPRRNILPMIGGDFDNTLSFVRQYVDRESEGNIKREKYMAENIMPLIFNEILKNPKLKDKKDINVLLTLGSFHSGLYDFLKGDNENVEKEYSSPHIDTYKDEAVRRRMNDEDIDDDLAAHVLFEEVFDDVFGEQLRQLTQDGMEIENYKRKTASQFSLEEIIEEFRMLSLLGYYSFKGSFEGRIKYLLEEKGFPFPQSEKDFRG